MRPSFSICALCAIALAVTRTIIMRPFSCTAQSASTSSLSKEDYANGAKRAAAAAKNATPKLQTALSKTGAKLGDPVFIRIFKEERQLEVWIQPAGTEKFKQLKTWDIAAMSGKLGPKTKEGDKQAPEGFYYVNRGRMNPTSKFHLAFNLGYPNTYDRAHGYTGSYLMVHGNRVSIGCYAMTDPSIEEIYTLCDAALNNGQTFFRVHCFPFRMTSTRMKQAETHPCFPFWSNLKIGFQWFETHQTPPNVEVRDKRYQFGL